MVKKPPKLCMGWSSQQGQQQPHLPRFQFYPSPPKARKYLTEEVLARFMVSTDANFDVVNATPRNVQASIQNLENQVSQLAKANSEHNYKVISQATLCLIEENNLRLSLWGMVEKLRFNQKKGWVWRKANMLWEMQPRKMRMLLRIATTKRKKSNNPNHHRRNNINSKSRT